MTTDEPEIPITPSPDEATPVAVPGTPLSWRLGIAATIVAIAVAAFLLRNMVGLRGQAFAGVLFYLGLVAMFSSNLRMVNWRTIGWGIALQLVLAMLV